MASTVFLPPIYLCQSDARLEMLSTAVKSKHTKYITKLILLEQSFSNSENKQELPP